MGLHMRVSYKKLFKLMIDKDVKKKDLKEKASIGNSTMSKLSNNENVTIEVLAKVCDAMKCTLDDIIDIIPDDKEGR